MLQPYPSVISFGIWFKTSESNQIMVMVHYGSYFGNVVRQKSQKDFFTLTLDNGLPVVRVQPTIELKSTNLTNLADDHWHHIAVSMPSKSCYVSQIEIYIDGDRASMTIANDHRIFQTTSGRMSLGGYGYSASGFEESYPGSGPYIGVLDDFALFARPLDIDVDFPSLIPSMPPSTSYVPSLKPSHNLTESPLPNRVEDFSTLMTSITPLGNYIPSLKPSLNLIGNLRTPSSPDALCSNMSGRTLQLKS